MKRLIKKSTSVFLAALILLSAAPIAGVVFDASAAVSSGDCGETVSWSFDSAEDVLSIYGTGDMTDYLAGKAPWSSACSEIKSVTVSDGVKSIGNNSFYSCENLSSVLLPDSLEVIGINAFRDCESLDSIELSPSLKSIGDEAFYGSGIRSITVPASVSQIGSDAFGWCAYLEAISVAEGNNCYSSDANGILYNANKTLLIKYPSGNKATNAEIPEGVTALADYAFENCYSLSEVFLPASLENIGNGAFFNCYLEKLAVDEQNPNYSSDSNGVLFNKDKSLLLLYPINNDRTNYSIPNTVVAVDESAFHNNISLKSIVIPESVASLGDEVFLFCNSLEFVHIPSSVTEIGADIIDSTYAYICSANENCYAKEYADKNGYTFAVCEGHGVSDICLSETEISIENKKTVCLGVTVLPDNADDKTVVWSSDNEAVASVEQNGVVTAVSVGTANITVTANDGGKTATCKVTVTPRRFRITWVVDGVETVKYQDEGAAISTPDTPFKIGSNFDGWTPQIPDVMPAENLTFTAQFSVGKYEAAFFAEGGKWPDGLCEKTVVTEYQREISIPEAPERTGYEFAGWTPQIPDAMPARYLEFTAEWTPNSYDAVFNANGGEWSDEATQKTVSASYDAQIIAPEAPAKQGYVFDGWTPEVGIMEDVNG